MQRMGEGRHTWGTECGAETSGKAGHGQHGEQQDEQSQNANRILDRAAGGVGEKGLYSGFHGDLPVCCWIVLILSPACKELFKNT
jgi:hypothetical protein